MEHRQVGARRVGAAIRSRTGESWRMTIFPPHWDHATLGGMLKITMVPDQTHPLAFCDRTGLAVVVPRRARIDGEKFFRGGHMPATPHLEQHFTASDTVRDIVIGMSDGLTVPFALAAGLSGAVAATGVVVTAGLAEVAAGSIAMGLGGYLAAKTDAEHYATERATEERETLEVPERETEEVADVFRGYGLSEDVVDTVVQAIISDRGMIPLSPYFMAPSVREALLASVAVTAIALGAFGYVKGRFTVKKPWRSAWQTMAVGGLAAAVAFGLAKLIG